MRANGWPIKVCKVFLFYSHLGRIRIEMSPTDSRPVVEQYRLLNEMLRVIQEVNGHTGMPICNPRECPTMSGGGG